VLFALTINGIRNPAPGQQADHSAEFTDTSGLSVNSDVRIRGIKVGKVTGIELRSTEDNRVVSVAEFTLSEDHWLTGQSKIAVKYANLSGVRFLDIENADGSGERVRDVPVAKTLSSFDITQLFNGLQPALETLSPDEINTFSNNALTLLQGDGGGLAPMLDSVSRLTRYASNRQEVIATLVRNVGRLTDSLGGKSPQIVTLLRYLEVPIDSITSVLGELAKADMYGPAFTTAVDTLLAGLGLNPDLDVDKFLQEALPTADLIAAAAEALPAVFNGLATPATSGDPQRSCSKGRAVLPELGALLINGSGVVICQA
jgi:phospholipid/cholesterol/gamma-HCH transport system substrate-binding protein